MDIFIDCEKVDGSIILKVFRNSDFLIKLRIPYTAIRDFYFILNIYFFSIFIHIFVIMEKLVSVQLINKGLLWTILLRF